MTIKEALQAAVSVSGIPDDRFEKALLDADIDGTGVYREGDKADVDVIAVAMLQGILVSSISEGGFSISYDRSAIEKLISTLKGEVVVKEKEPSIQGLRNLW